MEKATVERTLDASIKDGSAYAVMAGLGETTYVGALGLLLGGTPSEIALLATVPLFLGACAQLLTPLLIEKTGRRKPIFVVSSLVQALSWIPMTLSMFLPAPWGFWTLFGGFTVFFAALQFGAPAWISVMGDLVPPAERGRFFGRRSGIAFLMQFLAMLVAGAGLAVYKSAGHEMLGYAVVFAGAFAARLLSVWHVTRMVEPPHAPVRDEDRFTLWQFLRRLPHSNFAKFVVFVGCLVAAAQFAGALFIPYWRQQLGFNYWELMAVSSVIVLVMIVAVPFWGRMADRYGNKKVLKITSVGIAILPALWLASTHIVWACALQVWSGIVWSGFNQSMGNFLYDAVTPPKRARCMSYLQLLMSVGILVGGVAGSVAIKHVPTDLGLVRMPYAFWTILLASFVLRAVTVAYFLPRIREVREVPQAGTVSVLFDSTREAAASAVEFVAGFVRREEDPVEETSDTTRDIRL